jgi:hypothetical protein
MLGQPMIVLLYARDYQTGMYGPWTEADSKSPRLPCLPCLPASIRVLTCLLRTRARRAP